MRTPTKVITALALAGIAVAGGAAFTGGGLQGKVAENSAFVGGAISTQVTGAELLDVDYKWDAVVNGGSTIKEVTLTFDAATPEHSEVAINFDNNADPAIDTLLDVWKPNTVTLDEVSGHEIVTFIDDLTLTTRPLTGDDFSNAVAGQNTGVKVIVPAAPAASPMLDVTVTTAGDDLPATA